MFTSKDNKHVLISGTGANIFRRFFEAIGMPHIPKDPRFSAPKARMVNVALVDEIVTEWASRHTLDEILEIGRRSGCAIAPVQDIEQVYNDPQLKFREAFVMVEDPDLGEYPYIQFPAKFRNGEVGIRRPAGSVGQYNHEVICGDLGRTQEEYEALVAEGVI